MTAQEESNIKVSLNHAEFIVLGLIAENPSHAYSINKRIEDRGMRNWTNIGRSSIYRVIKDLEKKGLTDKWIEEVDNRILKVYNITEKGSKVLKEKVFRVISEFIGKKDEDFYVAFSLFPILTYEQQIEAINSSSNKIKKHKKELEDMLEKNSHRSLNVRGLFVHPIKILGIDIEFLNWVLEEIKKEEGNSGPKTQGK